MLDKVQSARSNWIDLPGLECNIIAMLVFSGTDRSFVMKIVSMLIVVFIFPICIFAQSKTPEEHEPATQSHTPGLMITGRSIVEVMPDVFEVTGIALGEAETRSESLQVVSNQLSELRSNLPALEGLSMFEMTTSEALINSVRPNGCDETNRSRRERPEDCSPVAENVRVEFKITGHPVEAAGAVVAFASEMNLERVTLTGFQVSDPSAAQKRAQTLALKDAIDRATRLAEASGGTLGSILAMSDQKNRRLRWDEFIGESVLSELMLSDVAISDRRRPQVELFIQPEAQIFQGEIHAHFEIKLSGTSK